MHFEFERFIHETQLRIRAFIRGCGVSQDYVDDLAQDAYLAFFRDQKKMPEGMDPYRWLKGISRNICLNHFRAYRKHQAKTRTAIAAILSQAGMQPDIGPQEDMQQRLQWCLEKMPEKSRKIITLRYERDLISEKISRLVNMTPAAVRKALFRIRDALRKCMENRSVQEAQA